MSTLSPNRPLVRIAVDLQNRLTASRPVVRPVELPAERWHHCETLLSQVRRATQKNWQLAARVLRRDLSYELNLQVRALNELKCQLETASPQSGKTTAGDLYQDLLALEDEFEQVNHHRAGRTLSVRTESIELAGIFLGPFEIRLDVGSLGNEPEYRVIALDPHPADARPGVTHPHILDDVLCEGEGRQAIRRAVAQGRLWDFFQLVAGVLRTYNDESPFVELVNWYSQACHDCGQLTVDEDGLSCAVCGDWVCSECDVSCGGCGDGCCAPCLAPCHVCDDHYCRHCLGTCAGCRRDACQPCLLDDERCPNCHEQESSEEPVENGRPAPVSHTAADAHRLGQAAVSA